MEAPHLHVTVHLPFHVPWCLLNRYAPPRMYYVRNIINRIMESIQVLLLNSRFLFLSNLPLPISTISPRVINIIIIPPPGYQTFDYVLGLFIITKPSVK